MTITGEGGAATYVVSSPIWANQVSSYGVQLITNAQAGSINFGSLDLVYTCASCWTRLFVPTASDLSVQTVTQGGVSLSYSTQGFITSFSATGGSSAWEVYFGQAASDGGDTTHHHDPHDDELHFERGGGGPLRQLRDDVLHRDHPHRRGRRHRR